MGSGREKSGVEQKEEILLRSTDLMKDLGTNERDVIKCWARFTSKSMEENDPYRGLYHVMDMKRPLWYFAVIGMQSVSEEMMKAINQLPIAGEVL